MALRKNDLDELSRPPRRVRALPQLPMAAGAEHITGEEDAEMGERTVADILLEQVQVIDGKIDDVVKNQLELKGQTALELTAIRRDIDDLKEWKQRVEQAPEKHLQQTATRTSITFQHLNGYLGLASLLLVVVTTIVAPWFAAHWH